MGLVIAERRSWPKCSSTTPRSVQQRQTDPGLAQLPYTLLDADGVVCACVVRLLVQLRHLDIGSRARNPAKNNTIHGKVPHTPATEQAEQNNKRRRRSLIAFTSVWDVCRRPVSWQCPWQSTAPYNRSGCARTPSAMVQPTHSSNQPHSITAINCITGLIVARCCLCVS